MEREKLGINDDSVEEYIRNLPWSAEASVSEQVLVAGNIRTFWHWVQAYAPSEGES